MSTPLQFFAPVPATPNVFMVDAVGMTDITNIQPANGWVITDLHISPVNIQSVTAGGVLVCGFQLGVYQTAGGFFVPFHTYEVAIISAASGNVSLQGQDVTRAFGTGMVLQAGYNRMMIKCNVATNLLSSNFVIDMSGFQY